MAGHLAINDVVRVTAMRTTATTGTATASAVAGEPVASIGTLPLGRAAAWTVAGGASGGSVIVRAYSGTARPLRVFAALGMQVPAGCTSIAVRALNGSTTPTGTAPEALAAGDFMRPFDSDRQPWNVVWTVDTPINGDGMQITFTLAAGASGTLRVGRLWASESLRFAAGVGGAWSQTIEDASIVSYGPQGRSPSVYSGPAWRRIRAPLNVLPEAEAIGATDRALDSVQAAAAYLGRGRECILIPRDSSAVYRQRLPVYGVFAQPVDIARVRGPYYSTSIELEEIR